PDAYFCGFERYKTELARSNATGILTYELGYVRQLMQELAKAGIDELKNVHRPALAEENGTQFQPGPNDVARAMPLEITFSGTEESVRKFFTALANPENGFVVVRSLRVSNSKRGVPPKAGDAKFDNPSKAAPAAGTAADLFSGGFVLPGEEEEAAPAEGDAAAENDATAADAPEETPAPSPEPESSDSSRILQQVLGSEDVQVFVRIDLMQFLPAKELP
ncbi:MAG: Amuc_1100 family pilus-like protein, partial [Verrucomicrobiae bacterium]|nr:Amuc_1100 family pilus-like protein [Verrucomicrobiae bacterium]